jgi:hypothetical protein
LETELGAIRDTVEALGPAAKDSEKIKEHLKELEVSSCLVLYLAFFVLTYFLNDKQFLVLQYTGCIKKNATSEFPKKSTLF